MSSAVAALLTPASAILLLGLAVATVWLPRGPMAWPVWPVWPVPLLAAVLCGLASGLIAPSGLIALGLLLGLALVARRSRSATLAAASTAAAALLALLLALHKLPGFVPLRIVESVRLGPDAQPFSLNANVDTGVAGLVLLACLCQPSHTAAQWLSVVRRTPVPLALTVAAVIAVSLGAGLVRVDFKLPAFAAQFLSINLLFTCVAEEAFFRGLIQARLANWLAGRRVASWLPIGVASLLFGLAHLGGGLLYGAIAALAGVGYGWAYARSGRIESAVLTHFALNAIHFFAFTYPRLAA